MAANADQASFDYIIVGAGSAGCVLANRLTASGRHRVLLLEAGGHDRHFWIHVPLGFGKLFDNAKVNWLYKSEPEPELNNRSIIQPRGKVWGGSSSINGLLYIRGQHEDFDHWRQLGNAGWGFADVLPYFRRAEDQERGADELHGAGGPLAVSDVCEPHPLCEAFIAAAQAAGFPRNDDFNGARQEGAGYFQLTAKNGRRWSTAVGYLRQARRRRKSCGGVECAGDPRFVFRPARRRRRISPRRCDAHRSCRRRSDPRRRRIQLAATVAALGAWTGESAARPRHCGDRRPARRRRRPAGPSAGAHAVPLHRTDHHERSDQSLAPPLRRRLALSHDAQGSAHHRRRLLRRVPAHPAGIGDAGHANPFSHFQRRCRGRRVACVSRLHGLGLPITAGQPRLRAHQIGAIQGCRRRSSRAI